MPTNWTQALEDQLNAMRFAARTARNYRDHEMARTLQIDGMALTQAKTFYWSEKCVEVVQASMPAFNLDELRSARELFYCDGAWCWFERPWLTIKLSTGDSPMVALSWYWTVFFDTVQELQAERNGHPVIGITAWIRVKTGDLTPVLWEMVDEGQPLSRGLAGSAPSKMAEWDDDAVKEVDQIKRFIVAASTFLRQKLLSEAERSIPRQARKRVNRAGWVGEPIVSVVQLRAREAGESRGESTDSDVEWSHRWIVRGHVRQQYYPSIGQHLPIWIHPHIKGPEDAPLKPRATPLFVVAR